MNNPILRDKLIEAQGPAPKEEEEQTFTRYVIPPRKRRLPIHSFMQPSIPEVTVTPSKPIAKPIEVPAPEPPLQIVREPAPAPSPERTVERFKATQARLKDKRTILAVRLEAHRKREAELEAMLALEREGMLAAMGEVEECDKAIAYLEEAGERIPGIEKMLGTVEPEDQYLSADEVRSYIQSLSLGQQFTSQDVFEHFEPTFGPVKSQVIARINYLAQGSDPVLESVSRGVYERRR